MKTNDVVTVIEKDFPKGYLIPSQKGDTMDQETRSETEALMRRLRALELARVDVAKRFPTVNDGSFRQIITYQEMRIVYWYGRLERGESC